MMRRTLANSSAGRRGSVFILVVAVLSVLVLLTLTLSYVSRMDLLASRNFGNTVQSRIAALTGVPVFQNGGTNGATYAPALGGPGGMAAGRRRQSARMTSVLNTGLGAGMHGRSGLADRNGQMGPMDPMSPVTPMNAMNSMSAMDPMAVSGSQVDGALTPLKLELELQEGREAGVAMSPSARARAALTGFTPGQSMASGTPAPGMRGPRDRGGLNSMRGQRRGRLDDAGVQSDPGLASEQDQTSESSENLAEALIEDESAKLDINAVVPDGVTDSRRGSQLSGTPGTVLDAPDRVTESMLARLIAEVAAARQVGGVDAQGLAHRIALHRYGKDGRPGRAFTDDNANNGMTDPLHDGIDNDGDGLIDEPDEALVATAHDGLDNNRNGVIDEPGESIAQDGLDNNHDGQIDESNEAIDDPAEAGCDPRKPGVGDDTPYGSLEELMSVDGMTPALYRALTPYLTVFSVSFAAYAVDEDQPTGAGEMLHSRRSRNAPGLSASEALVRRGQQGWLGRPGQAGGRDEAAEGLPQIDPNTAPPELLYEVLKQRFPEASDDLLGQFIANLIDRRDQDNVPTTIRIGSKSYTGIEINPCINEICPDPTPGENNDGQFVELYNPWSQSVNLTGWSLRGQGIQTPLNGTLPSGGFLVLTNDINNENDSTPEDDGNEGSFYNVFHKVGTGGQHQLVEIQGMNLAASGKVQLVNPQGLVVDEFDYSQGQCSGTTRSFQRKDPRLRAWEFLPATPLDVNQGAAPSPQDTQALKIMEQWQNQPFRSPLDVMLVSTAFAAGQAGGTSQVFNEIDARQRVTGGMTGQHGSRPQTRGEVSMGGNANGGRPARAVARGAAPMDSQDAGSEPESGAATSTQHAYQMPQLNAAGSNNLDVRLVDCFRIGAMIPRESDTQPSDLVGTQVDANNANGASGLNGMRGTTGAGLMASRRGLADLSGRRGRLGQSLSGGLASSDADASSEAKLPEAPRCQAIFGRVNLNTASAAVLAALPGMDQDLVARILASRASGGDPEAWGNGQTASVLANATPASGLWWLAESPFARPRWANLSDFLTDESLWEGRPLYDRLDAIYSFSQLVTLHTMSVLVATASRPSEPVEARSNGKTVELVTKSGKRPSLARTQRIIAGDRGAPETVSFRFVGNYGEKQIDPDATYAAPAGKVKPMDLKQYLAQVAKAGGKVSNGMTATRAELSRETTNRIGTAATTALPATSQLRRASGRRSGTGR